MMPPAIERALPADAAAIEELLTSAGLPTAGVREHLAHFLVARAAGAVIGVIGLEPYGEAGLLRSLAVRAEYRSRGMGNTLYARLLDEARAKGIKRLVLLTTTAERWFAGRGFARIDADNVRGGMRSSAEFTGACPSTAVCMELKL